MTINFGESERSVEAPNDSDRIQQCIDSIVHVWHSLGKRSDDTIGGISCRVWLYGHRHGDQLIHYQEALVGEAMLALAKQAITRDRLFLQTKFTPANGQDHRTPYDPSANLTTQVRQSFDSSLSHLHIDQVDSYVLHGPYQWRGLGKADWEVWTASRDSMTQAKLK